jgi:hypothetical protein
MVRPESFVLYSEFLGKKRVASIHLIINPTRLRLQWTNAQRPVRAGTVWSG